MFYKVLLVFLVSLATSYSATAQTPTLNFVPENEVFIGEQTCFEVSFVNTGTPGYGPYVRLILPADFNFDGATFAGSGQTVQNLGVITSSAPNNFVIDPTATSNANSTTNDTIFAPVGSTVLLLEYPVGSLVDGGVALISEVCVTVTAGATVGTPQDVCVQGMYEFGDTPTGDNGSIAATAVCQPITPILYRFEKRIGGSDGLYEGVPGGGGAGCHIHEYQLNVDIAAAGTLSGPIIITDALPGQLVYFGNISTPTGCAVTQQPTVGTAGGTVEVTCNGSFSGSTAAIDMQVTFDAAVADTLDETICDQDSFFNNASAVVAGNPTQRDTVQTNIDHLDLSHANNAVGAVSIGQTVQYTIGAKITEYTAGLTSASITFVVADGMVYNPASLTWAGAPVLAGNTTIVAGPGTGSTVTVDIHTQNGANILPCAGPALQYTADVNQTYANGDPVLSRDVLTHTSTITYDLAEGAAGCTDDAGTSINLNDIFIQKTVNNSPPTGAGRNGQWWPGDVVQYRLELRVPSLDLDDVIITDFFPLPIHDVTDLATTFGTDVRFDASTCSSTPPINYTINAAANSLELEFGDLSNSITGGCVDIVLLIDIPITTIPFADGLFHSNFMQVNSDNTAADDETKTVLTLIQVAAPDLDLTKGIVSSTNPNVVISPVVSPPDGNATQVNGGDSLFYQITIENEGAAPGYDLNITDVAPPELTNCTLVGATPVVDGNNNAIPFTGGFSGNSLNIDVATADSIAFAGAGANNFFINISYVCEVVPNIGAATILDNTAQVDWSSARGSVAFPPISDAARAVAASPTMNKIVDYIMPNHSGNNSQALIGEVIAYEVQLYIPEGNLDNLTLTDRVEEGLAFVGVDSIVLCTSTGATNIATSVAGGFASVQSGATISNIGAAPQQQDRELVLDFGNIQNLDTDNVNDTIKVFYQTIVINHSTNSNGQQLRNIATARWDNPNTPGNQLSINDRAPFVTVIEPALEVTKSFMPEDVLPNNTSFVTITVSNPATISSAPAYNVNLQDVLPTGMLFVAGSGITQGGTAMISDSARFSGNTLTAGFDTINVGETYSVTFEVGISSAITPCFTLTNCANITWESIAQAAQATQPMAFSSNLGVKRSGNPTALGGTANDYSRDSCADLNVVIDNTFDPFITGNTPICEGERAVLQVQQYNGNRVTYNWTGPGVPAGFNNFELILDPVSAADVGTYYVIVELDGCITDTSNFFQLNLRPQPNTPIISPDTTVCEGSQVQFTTSTIANSYTWTGPNGFSANSATTPLIRPITFSDAGVYSLFTTNSQGCNSPTVSLTLGVNPRPNTPTLANNSPICSGENIMLSTNASADSYMWIAPNGQDTVTTTGTLTIIPNSSLYMAGNWALSVADANGCISQPSTVSNVIINRTPVNPITSNSGPICEGDDVTLNVNTIGGATYSWYSDAALSNLVATSQNPVISGLIAANLPDSFYVQINSNGCLSSVGVTGVLINSNPANFAPNYNAPICAGDSLALFANTTAATYSWAGPSGFVSNLANPIIANANANNAGSYALSIQDANNCSSTGVVQVAINTQPTTPTITSNAPLCEGNDLTLEVAAYTGNSVTYNWTTPTGTITTNVPMLTIANAAVADSGIYAIIVDLDGCSTLPDSTNIVIHAAPVAPNVPANFTVCEGQDTIVLTTNTIANRYTWTGPNGFSSTSPNPAAITPVSATNAGTYSLVVENFNGCTSVPANTIVTVNPRPNRPALSTNSAICQGEDLVLTTNAIATSYTWTAPNGASMTTTVDNLIVLANSGLYQSGDWTVAITDANGCTSMASIASNVVINSVPNSASPTNNGAICNGSAAQLSAGTIAGASYAWYTDAAATNQFSTLQNPMVSNLTNDSTFYLIVTVNGCATPIDSTIVSVLAVPTTPIIIADSAVCEGQNITLTTSRNATGYTWTGPNGFASSQQNPAVIVNATTADAGTYTLFVTDANGCTSADTTAVVVVNTAPAAAVLTNNSAICTGDTLVLNTTATADTFRWITPNGLDTFTTSNSLVIVPTNTAYYQAGDWALTTQVGNNCPSMLSSNSTVVINSATAAPTATNNGPVCTGAMVTLSTPAAPNASYEWYSDAALTNLIATTATTTVNNITTDSTFYVVVIVSGCTSPAATTTVQVIPQPAAPIIAADSAVCAGDNITLTTTTIANSYVWTGPNGFSATQQNPAVITNATTANAGVYSLQVVYSNGCQSADTMATVIVNQNPAQPVLSTNSAICAGDNLVLTTNVMTASYTWIAPNGVDTATTTNSLTINSTSGFYQSGNWTLVTTNTAGCSSVASAASNVVINAVPTAPLVNNNGPVCNGATGSFTTAFQNGATYEWYSDAALTNVVSVMQNPTLSNITNDTTWYLVVTQNGCSSAATASTIRVLPVPNAPNIPADFDVCQGDNITLSTTTRAASYNWTGPNGFTSNLQNPSVVQNATAADAGVYTLFITDINGCQSSDTSVIVLVNPNPAQPVLSTNSAICMGEDLVLTTNAMAASYIWTAPNGIDTTTTSNSLIINVLSDYYQPGNWTVVAVSTAGCQSVASTPRNVIINLVPVAALVNNNGPVCNGASGQFSATIQSGAIPEWYSDASLMNLVSTIPNPTLNTITSDTTWHLVVTENGCPSAATRGTIQVLPAPNAPNMPADFAVCGGDNITLSTTTRAASYNWTGPNGFTSNLQNPTVVQNATAADAGIYTLSTTTINGCQSSDTSVTVTVNANPPAPTIVSNSPLCFGDTLVLRSSTDCGQAQWIGPNGNSASTLGTVGNGNVLFTRGSLTRIPSTNANYLNGAWYMLCIDTTTGCATESNTINVTINPIPVVSAFNNGAICSGENGELSATPISGATYEWYSDSNLTTLVSTVRTPTIMAMMASATYYVVATVNGCTSLADSTRIEVIPAPVVPQPSYTPLCQLDTLFLFANATGNMATYRWTGPSGFVSTLENPVIPNIYPFNAGSYGLTVADSFGCDAFATVEVTIYPKPATPTISHNAPFCEGTMDLTLTTQAYFGTNVAYYWTLPNGTMDTTTIPSLIVSNATQSDTGLYRLMVFVDGCVSLAGEEEIRIYPTPATPAIPADFAVCVGDDIVLTTTTNAANYFWTGPNGFQSNLPSPTVVSASAIDTGVYTLYVTNTQGCRSTDTSVYVGVNANPAMPTIVSNTPICFGDTLVLSSSSSCDQSQWIGPNGNSASTLGTAGGGNVLFTNGSTTRIPATNSNYLNGAWYMICIDTTTGCRTESNTINVEITPVPATPAVFNNSPICIGEDVQLTTTTVTGASYNWYADSTQQVLVATSQNPIIRNITSDTAFYLFVTVNGCTSAAGVNTVLVNPIPATPSVAADFAICAGDALVLNTTTVAASYNWTGPNGFVSNLQNPTVVQNATLVDSGSYVLSIVDNNGCESADTMVQVTVNPNPTQAVLTSNSSICEGDNIVLSTTAAAANYRWTAPNGADTTTTIANLVIDATSNFYQDGDWTVVVIDSNGCESSISNIENVVINGIPTNQAIFNSGPVCVAEAANLFTSFVNGASYEWYADSNQTTLVATAQNPTVRNIRTDSTFYLYLTVNGCRALVGTTTVNVHAIPTAPTVADSITVCQGDALVLATTTRAAGYNWTGPNGFQSNLQNPSVVSMAGVVDSGTYNLYIIDSNGCQSLDATTTVVVDPIPVTPFITSNNTPICAGDDLILTASNAVAGATYEWFSASSNLSVGIGQTLTITAATTTNAGDYYVVTTLNNCNSEPSAVTTAIIDAIPTTQAFAGTDIGLCNQFGTNLNAAVPNSATGIWTTNSGATIANANSPNTAVYNLPIGSSTFYWTLSNGACLDFSSDSMIVDVTPSSSDVANAGLDQRLCGVDSATLVATAPTTSTGMWTQSAAQAGQGVVIANPTNATTTVNGLQGGTNYNFVWTLSNGNCVDYSSDIVNIDIAAAPIDVAYAGTPILVCDQTTINLAAQASQYGTGMWTTTSSATIIDPTSATTTVVNLAQDSSYFVWSLSNGICMDYSVDSVLVVSSSSTDIAEAGNNQVICNSNTNLTATAPSAGTGRWSQTNSQAAQGVTIVNPTDPATQVIGMTANTTYVFTWVLSNGTCVDYSSDNVAITVNAIPPDNAFAGNDINLCGVTTTSQLNASVPVAAMGLWTTSSTATISNPTRPSTTVSGLSIGQNIFVWTLSSGSCVDYDTDTIVITVTAPSNDVADAGLDSAYCNQTTVQLNAAAPTVGGGYWSQTASQASLGATITTPTDTATTVNGLIAGVTYTFTWTLTNGGCVDYSNDQVLITIDALPTNVAYAGEDTILCGGNRLQLEATMPPIGTGFWTTNDSATIVTPSAFNTQVVNIQEDTTVYYWTLSNGACVDYSVDSMEVIISPASRDIAFAGFDQTLCGVDSILLQADTLTSSTGRWTQTSAQSSQGIVINNPTQPNATVTGIQVGQSYNFTWTISTLGCPNFSTDEVTYNINALPPEVAYAGTDIILCAANSTNLDATNPQFSTGRWLSNSTSLIINPTLPNTNVVNIPTDTVAFYWALSNGACIDYSIDTMLVIVTPTTSVDTANAGLDIAVCNADTAQLMALTPTVATGRWTQPNNQASAGVVITNVNDPNSTVTGLQLDSTYSFSWSVSNGPCVDYDTDAVQVQVSSLPSDAAYAGLDVVICNEDEITLIATTPSVGTGFWTTTSSATIVTPPRTTTEIVNLPFGVNQFIWTLSNGACRNYSTDTVLVEIDDAPVANADSFVVIYNSAGNTIDVTPNDDLNTNWIITVTEGINKGILTNLGTGEFDIVLTDILVDQQFIYQLCNPNCPVRYCDTARVVIDVQGGFECNIPNMMTPNGDDINENFVIPCLDGLEGTKLQVYNRWGDLMYESDNYKNTWNATHNEMPVPDATYFYIMELEDGRKYQGFVEVRR